MRWKSTAIWSASVVTLWLAVTGTTFNSAASAPSKPVVTMYLSTDCPVVARSSPRIKALVDQYAAQGFTFEAVFPNEGETRTKTSQFLTSRGLALDPILDTGGERARKDRVEIVPTFIVRDATGRTLYRGSLDDAKVDANVRNSYLADALAAISAGRTPQKAVTEPFGCYLMAGDPLPRPTEVNFAEHVAPILNTDCLSCHRENEVAPFSLEGYENARKWSRMIARAATNGTMPPWRAVEGIGEFQHEARLSEREKAILTRWAKAGAPSGDLSKAPKTPEFPKGWSLGEPDMVLGMPVPFKLTAEGRDEYWNFVLTPDITEPVYVQAIDVKPGNKSVVHHVIAFIDDNGDSEKLLANGRDGGYLTFGGPGFIPDNSLGGWAPGLMPARKPAGTGYRLKPGSRIVMQVHYHKTGKEEIDQTKIGLYFAKEKVDTPLEIAWLANPLLNIPAGAENHRVVQNIPIPVNVTLYSLMPHMHLLGQQMKATWVKPDGSEQVLIQIDDWDFNWQLEYTLKEPLLIPAGSRLRIEAVYDNSTNNPYNPSNPPRTVRWGEETTDEMMLLVASVHIHRGPVLQRVQERRDGN